MPGLLNDSGDTLCAPRDAKSISSRYHAHDGFYYYSGVAALVIIISSSLVLLSRRVTVAKNNTHTGRKRLLVMFFDTQPRTLSPPSIRQVYGNEYPLPTCKRAFTPKQ